MTIAGLRRAIVSFPVQLPRFNSQPDVVVFRLAQEIGLRTCHLLLMADSSNGRDGATKGVLLSPGRCTVRMPCGSSSMSSEASERT